MRNLLSKLFPCASRKRIIKGSSKKHWAHRRTKIRRNYCFSFFHLGCVSRRFPRLRRQLPFSLSHRARDRQTCRPGFEEVRWTQQQIHPQSCEELPMRGSRRRIMAAQAENGSFPLEDSGWRPMERCGAAMLWFTCLPKSWRRCGCCWPMPDRLFRPSAETRALGRRTRNRRQRSQMLVFPAGTA